MDLFDVNVVRAAYDTVADEYVEAFADDLDALPLDRAVLDALASRIDGAGPVLDLGCGPGQVADYLTRHHVGVVGLDPATRMLRFATRRAERAAFMCGDMRILPLRSQSFSAAIAFYSVQHLSRSELGKALSEIRRVLMPGGLLVIAAHLGDGEITMDEFLGHRIEPVGGTFFTEGELRSQLDRRSFVVERTQLRDPLSHEYPSKRIYVTARRRD
jgi:ubiquinone/menaquinone biosynthesis C-methylase UbiE